MNIPALKVRNKSPNQYLPATFIHPLAQGNFRSAVAPNSPGETDLGVWNIYANSDFPHPQVALRNMLCHIEGGQCAKDILLKRSIAAFKTPTLRDLGQSAPYLHTGEKDTLEEVLHFYRNMSALAKKGKIRAGDPRLKDITLTEKDSVTLIAFLKSLNEDYE